MKKTIYAGPVCSLPPGRGRIFGKLTAWLMLFCLSFSSMAQNPFRVKGTVTAENGKGLPGASVVLKGTTTGATTDADGKYTLALPNGQGTLQVSYIGYVSKEVAVGNQRRSISAWIRATPTWMKSW